MITRFILVRWLTICGFISITEVTDENKVVCSSKPVTAEEKKDVILQCHLEPKRDARDETVEWKSQKKLVHLYRSRGDDIFHQDSKFKGRTSLFHNEMVQGNISLKLTEITKEDAGNYTCRVPKLSHQLWEGTVTLNVVDPVHKDDGSEKVSSTTPGLTSTYSVIGLVVFALVALIVGRNCIWKWKIKSGTTGQRQVNEDIPLRTSPVPISDAEPEGSPLRRRITAVPKNDKASAEADTKSNITTSPP